MARGETQRRPGETLQEGFSVQNPQASQREQQIPAPPRIAIDLAQLRAAKSEVRETVSQQEANAQKVVAATWALLERAVPRDASLRTLLG